MPFLSTMTVGLVSGALLTTEIENTGPIVDSFELQRLQTEFPGVGTWNAPDGRLNRIFGRPMETGASPRETAMKVVRKWSGIWGLTPKNLMLAGPFPGDDRTEQTLMWDQATETYKFTAVYFKQNVQGVPVYNSRLQVLVRNDSGYPAVSIGTDLRNVEALAGVSRPAGIERSMVDARAADFLGSDFVYVSEPELVVYAGYDFESVPATFAYVFDAEVGTVRDLDNYQKARYIIDASSGELLRKENLVLNCTHNERIANAIFASATAIDGVVTGANTITSRAEACDPEVQVGMPYLAIPDNINGTVYTDYEGNATGLVGGQRTLTVDGRYFDVNYSSGTPYSQTVTIEPGLPFNIALNPTNESGKAAMNAYIESNVVRDFTLARNPSYPTIGNQFDWDINIGVSGSCNAFYNGSSINFYNAGGGCNNTAFSVIVHHEYGHHLVSVGGSGQNEFGEGSGDVMGVLIERDSQLARGFFTNDCNSGIRNADNTCTFDASSCSSCGSAIHSCGQLISGCVWDCVAAFEDSGMTPDEANFYMGDLYVNMIPLHSGGSIQQDILIDILTLDDNDGNLNNGSPNYFEIAAGFAVHGFDAPELSGLDFQFPNGTPSVISPFDGVDLAMNVSGISFQPAPNTGTLYIARSNGTVDDIAMPQVADSQYLLSFSDIECDEAVGYYFSAETTTGDVFYWPGGQTSVPSPNTRFSGIGATGEIIAFEDDFQTDTGWTVSGGAVDGQWGRGVPIDCDRADPPSDADGSGFCFLTDNSSANNCNSDVDDGQTILTSPALDASAPGSVISYSRWFDNTFGNAPNEDTMFVQVSGDGGLSWVGLEVVGPVAEADGGWYQKQFLVSSYVANSTNFRIRFIAQDTGEGSVVEAAVDGVRLLATECIDDGPACPGDVDGNETVDFNDLVSLLSAWDSACSGCPEDVDGSGTVGFDDLIGLLSAFGPCP